MPVSRKDPRFLELSEGRPLFAVGQNLAFIGPGQYASLSKAEEMFDRLAAQGANFVRIWACCEDWATAVEARKSAWSRSWSPKMPLDTTGDAQGVPTGLRYLALGGGRPDSISLSPCNPVALLPATRYSLAAEVRAESNARLEILVHGVNLDGPLMAAAPGRWTRLEREFTTGPKQFWLDPVVFRAKGGPVAFTSLSLREAAGGPELLWEAELNRPIRGFYNPVDCFTVDKILEAAQLRGIYVQVCLVTRDLYMKDLKDPKSRDYDEVIRRVKNLFRYAVARWGYATSLGAWEYFNEIDPGLPTDRFYAELGAYLAEIDPYLHLRTTSTWSSSPKDWRHPRLDLAEEHRYLRPSLKEAYQDEVADVLQRVAAVREHAPRKPIFLGEYGLAGNQWELSPVMKDDVELVHFHNATMVLGPVGGRGNRHVLVVGPVGPHGGLPCLSGREQFHGGHPLDDGRITRDFRWRFRRRGPRGRPARERLRLRLALQPPGRLVERRHRKEGLIAG